MSESEFLISVHPSTPNAYSGCSPWIWMNLFLELLSFPKSCLLMMISSPLTMLLEQKVHYSHHIQQMPLENLYHYSHFLKMAKCQNRETQPLYSSWEMKLNVQRRLYWWNDGYRFFFRIGHHHVILCSNVLCLKGSMPATSRDRRWCVQCGGKMTRNILLFNKISANSNHIHHVAIACPFIDNFNIFCYF